MELIKVVHPKAGEAMVPESSLRHHVRAGWRRADEPEPETKAEPERRRRRDTNETSEES